METPKWKSFILEMNPLPSSQQPTQQWSSRLKVKVLDSATSAGMVSAWKPLAPISQWHRHVSQSKSERQSQVHNLKPCRCFTHTCVRQVSHYPGCSILDVFDSGGVFQRPRSFCFVLEHLHIPSYIRVGGEWLHNVPHSHPPFIQICSWENFLNGIKTPG